MTAIDAEARAEEHEHEWHGWSYAEPDSGGYVTRARICDGVITDECDAIQYDRVPADSPDYLDWIREWRRDMLHLPATPNTAIWHEGNDWDEQEER